MPAKRTATTTRTREVERDEPEDEGTTPLPGAGSLSEALDQQQKLADKNNRPSDVADESEFEPLDDDDDVPPTEVSSTDEVPVNE